MSTGNIPSGCYQVHKAGLTVEKEGRVQLYDLFHESIINSIRISLIACQPFIHAPINNFGTTFIGKNHGYLALGAQRGANV